MNITVTFNEQERQVMGALIDAAVKALGVQCIKGVAHIVDKFDAAIAEAQNAAKETPHAELTGQPKAE